MANSPDTRNQDSETDNKTEASAFEQQARQAAPGFAKEFWIFLKQNKKWWLTPIILVLLLMGLLIFLGGTGAAPFIYTLF